VGGRCPSSDCARPLRQPAAVSDLEGVESTVSVDMRRRRPGHPDESMIDSRLMVAALDNAQLVGGFCLVIGILVLASGVFVGLWTSLRDAPAAQKEKLKDAETKLDQAKGSVERAVAGAPGVKTTDEAAKDATKAIDEAQSAIQQVGAIVASLPENLRFAGLLVLIGAVLMGVATIQFGGTSLF
jgi:hypothetical protein